MKLEQINLKRREPHVIIKRNLCENNIQKINNVLNEWSPSVNFENLDVNNGFETFHSRLLHTIDDIAPERQLTVSTNRVISRPWITKGLMRCSKKQLALYQDALKSKTDLKFQ